MCNGMSQSVNRSRPWNTPYWFMLGVMVINFLEFFINLKVSLKVTTNIPTKVLFIILLWPSFILVEVVIYWVIRKRINERKWVWAHLLFSLFTFVMLEILRFLVFALIFYYNRNNGYHSLPIINSIYFYSFWSSFII